MQALVLDCDEDDRDLLSSELWDLGAEGIIEHDSYLEAFFVEVRNPLTAQFSQRGAHWVEHPDTDWEQQTRDAFPPLLIGETFFLVPPWCAEPPPKGRVRLEITPGRACGTGWHACTQMCLEAMERILTAGDSVLDVGTGSGILSVGAKLLGAGTIVGCDVDPDAVATAAERVDNPLFIGSADAVGNDSFDLIVANISEAVVLDLWPDFNRIRKSGGHLILSGFPSMDGLPPAAEVIEREGWLCFVY